MRTTEEMSFGSVSQPSSRSGASTSEPVISTPCSPVGAKTGGRSMPSTAPPRLASRTARISEASFYKRPKCLHHRFGCDRTSSRSSRRRPVCFSLNHPRRTPPTCRSRGRLLRRIDASRVGLHAPGRSTPPRSACHHKLKEARNPTKASVNYKIQRRIELSKA